MLQKYVMNWKDLNSIDDLNAAISASDNGLVILFKHSTRCSISRMALKMLEMGWDESLAGVEAYYLDLLNHRDAVVLSLISLISNTKPANAG